MIKSPVEGNSIVLLKLDHPVAFSDFIRPACLPSSDEFIHLGASCATLAWTTLDSEQLRLVELRPADQKKCEEFSEVAPNTICAQGKVQHKNETTSESCDVSITFLMRQSRQ